MATIQGYFMRTLFFILLFLLSCNNKKSGDPVAVFNGESSELKKSKVVGVLNTEIKPGQNLIWCSTLVSSWKEIEKNITKEPPLLSEDNQLVDSLNSAEDPKNYLPEEASFSAAGLVKDGIVEKIQEGLKKKFPNKSMPSLQAPTPDSLIAYAYLKAGITFTQPYHINEEAFRFTDSSGETSKVQSFGIFDRDTFSYDLAGQIGILYGKGTGNDKEFVVDLDDKSKKYQILLASIKPQKTLESALTYINSLSQDRRLYFKKGNTLIVPQTVWKVIHNYSELIGKKFKTKPLTDSPIIRAEQSIEFKLHSRGAEVESETVMEAKDADESEDRFDGRYDFNKPFYILMRKRGEDKPFFVMYVDNAELLHPW